MSSKLLREAMSDWVPYIEQEKGRFDDSVRKRLLSISSPTIDRILKPYKVNKGRSFTRNGGFRDEIPIQKNIWDVQIPGYVETDTVAHCGGSLSGEFINSVTTVDIATIWTEVRACFGKGSNAVFAQLLHTEGSLPFSIIGYDADNGGEVLNKHLYQYFTERGVEVTRAREYQSNDNAHVEQRNDSIARRYLGYDRLDFKILTALINYYYAEIVCPLHNHFYPTFKLKGKIRVNSKARRIYGKPVTPYKRVMLSPHVSKERKKALWKIHRNLNPVELKKREFVMRKQIDKAIKMLRQGIEPSQRILFPPDLNNDVSQFQVFNKLNHINTDLLHIFQ